MKAKLALLLVAACALALASGIPFRFRADLTDNGRYTLSPYTREVLAGLDSEVKVTWYRSREIRRYAENEREVRECLRDFASASRGFFAFDVRDPASSDVRVDVESLGIQPRGDASACYSGILVEHGGKSDAIPFVADRSRLEYDLLARIVALSAKKRAEIQVVFAVPGGAASCPYAIPWLEYSRFVVRELALPALDIDEGIPLVVIGSTNVDTVTAASIDSFLDAGGSAAFFVSGATVDTGGNWAATAKTVDPVIALLSRWGITVDDGIVMDETCWRMTLPSVDGTKYRSIDYPYWPRTVPVSTSASTASIASTTTSATGAHPASPASLLNGVGPLQFYWPSDILIDGTVAGTAQPVVETSENALVERAPFATDPFGKGIDRLRASAGKSRRHLAVASDSPARIVCVADELFAGTMGDYTGNDANLDFFVNCAEWISREDGLLSVKKTWPSSSAPSAVEVGPMTEYYERLRATMLAVMPALVVLAYAIARFARRKRRA